jgi:hypothetical protein
VHLAVRVFWRQFEVLDDHIVVIARIKLAEDASLQRDIGPGGADRRAGESRGGRRVDDDGSDVRRNRRGPAESRRGDNQTRPFEQ